MNPRDRQIEAERVHALTESEARVKVEELTACRKQLAQKELEVERLRADLAASERRVHHLKAEVEKKNNTIDVVMREVMNKKLTIQKLETENEELRDGMKTHAIANASLVSTHAAGGQMTQYNAAKLEGLAAGFMVKCLTEGIPLDTAVLKCLLEKPFLICERPMTHKALSILCSVLCHLDDSQRRSSLKAFVSLTLGSCEDTGYMVIADLLFCIRSLRSVTLPNITDRGLNYVLDTLESIGSVSTLHLPKPVELEDETVHRLLKVIRDRNARAAEQSPGASPSLLYLKLEALDLSSSSVTSATLQLIAVETLQEIHLPPSEATTDGVVRCIVSSCPNLHSLSLRGCTKITEQLLRMLNEHGERVTTLDIEGCSGIHEITLDHVRILRSTLEAVTVLSCPQLRLLPTPLHGFTVMKASFPHLQRFYLKGVYFGPREASLLATAAPRLRELMLVDCRVDELGTLLAKLRGLTCLFVRNCKGLKDADLSVVSPALQVVDFTNAYCITDTAMRNVLQQGAALTSLILRGCSNLTDQTLEAITVHIPESILTLNVIDCRKLTVLGLDRLVNGCPKLENIFHTTFQSVKLVTTPDDYLLSDLAKVTSSSYATEADVLNDWAVRSTTSAGLLKQPRTAIPFEPPSPYSWP